jgi:crossover junction endodeoxyribonuclease RuvC
MAIILGIDPGLHHTGWGVIKSEGSRLSFIACGTLHSKPKESMPLRLLSLSTQLETVIDQHPPCSCAVEETFINKNPLSSLKLGHARGALITTLARKSLPVSEYSATAVKKALTGVGRAEKHQIIMMIKYLMPAATPDSEDAADALAVAICHANMGTFNR